MNIDAKYDTLTIDLTRYTFVTSGGNTMSEIIKIQEQDDERKRLQDNLLLIRRAVGWTAEQLGERIGVTRQTINNIEAHRNKLSKTQYIAIRAVLDAEISKSPEDTEMLRCLLDVIIDNPNKYDKSEREELLNKANMLTPSILAGTTSREDVSKEFIKSAAKLGVIAIAATAAGVGAWLLKELNKES